MLDINILDLNLEAKKLNALIEEYENIQLNIFNQLKDSCVNWQDGNSLLFNDKIYQEKQESELFLLNLKKRKELYDFIYSNYIEIGKKIKCNLANQNSVLFFIDNCCEQIDSILYEYSKLDYGINIADVQKQIIELNNIKKGLLDIKNNIKKMCEKIRKIENEILLKIQNIEDVFINEFDFDII